MIDCVVVDINYGNKSSLSRGYIVWKDQKLKEDNIQIGVSQSLVIDALVGRIIIMVGQRWKRKIEDYSKRSLEKKQEKK